MNIGISQLRRLVLLVAVPLGLLVVGLVIYLQGGRYVETDNAYVKADVVTVATRVAGHIQQVWVEENQPVTAGEPLLQLDPAPFQLAVSRAEAQLAEVKTDLKALQAGYREKQGAVELARSEYVYAQRELKRQRDLQTSHFVSDSVIDDLEHRVNVSRQNLQLIELDLARLAASLNEQPAAPVDQHPRYLKAESELQSARYDLQGATVKAPHSGVVSQVPAAGSYAQPGRAVLALVVSERLWVEANFPETDLTHMQAGQAVTIDIDAYPQHHWRGRVASISPATGAEFAILPPQNATGNWVKIAQRVPVKIILEPVTATPSLRVGLSAVVTVDTQQQRRLFGQANGTP